MQHIEWTNKLSVGSKEIDDQHKQFIGHINALDTLLRGTYDKEKAKLIIQKLYDYAKHHFDTEEKHFEKYNYPAAFEHSMEHIKLLKKITEYSDKILWDSSKTTAQETLEFVINWLENHLKKQDMKFAKFLLKIGASETE